MILHKTFVVGVGLTFFLISFTAQAVVLECTYYASSGNWKQKHEPEKEKDSCQATPWDKCDPSSCKCSWEIGDDSYIQRIDYSPPLFKYSERVGTNGQTLVISRYTGELEQVVSLTDGRMVARKGTCKELKLNERKF